MSYRQNTKPSVKRDYTPVDRVKTEIIGVKVKSTRSGWELPARAHKMYQNDAKQLCFQLLKPFHLGVSGTINGTIAHSNQLLGELAE